MKQANPVLTTSKRAPRILAIALGLTITAAASAAPSVVVFPPTGTGMDDDDLEALGALVENRYPSTTHETIVGPDSSAAALRGAKDYADAARRLGGREFVLTNAVRLGDSVVVTLSRRDASDGASIRRARGSAASMKEVESVLDRLVSAVHGREDIAPVTILDPTLDDHPMPQIPRYPRRTLGFRGGGMGSVDGDESLGGLALVSFDGRIEGRREFLRFGSGLILSETDQPDSMDAALHIELGGGYYLKQSEWSPYIGAGLTQRIVLDVSPEDSPGAYVEAGIIGFRSRRTRLILDLRLTQNLKGMDWSSLGWVNPDPALGPHSVRPTEFLFSIGVGW